MFASLKKHGLSDTVHELKSQLTDSASRISHHQSSKVKRTQPASIVSKFQLPAEEAFSKKHTVLDVLIELITSKEEEACVVKQHEFNPTKYVCLEESCKKKIGCCYCFLQNHQMHTKIETALCLKDLVEIKEKVEQNRTKMKGELHKRRAQVRQSIQLEISKIRQQFNSSLNYLNAKILDSVERQFNQRLASIEKYLQVNQSTKESKEIKNEKVEHKKQNVQDCEFRQIVQAFRNRPNKDILHMSHLQKTSAVSKPKSQKKDYFCIYDISKEDEFALLDKLPKLNLAEVQQYLRHQGIIVQQFCQCLSIFNEYYNEMSASLSEFFATFKRAVPTCPSLQNRLNQPDFLKVFSC